MEKGNKVHATLIPAQWMKQYVLAVSLPPNAHINNRIQFNSVRRKKSEWKKIRWTNKAHAISRQWIRMRVSFSLDSSYLISTARVAFDVWCAVVILLFLFCCHFHNIWYGRPWYTPRICHHFVHVIAVAFYWFDFSTYFLCFSVDVGNDNQNWRDTLDSICPWPSCNTHTEQYNCFSANQLTLVFRYNFQFIVFFSFFHCFSLGRQYGVWILLWIGWNTFLICFYLNVGILNRVSSAECTKSNLVFCAASTTVVCRRWHKTHIRSFANFHHNTIL